MLSLGVAPYKHKCLEVDVLVALMIADVVAQLKDYHDFLWFDLTVCLLMVFRFVKCLAPRTLNIPLKNLIRLQLNALEQTSENFAWSRPGVEY